MIHTILDEIKGKILDLQYVERYGSIVVPVSQDVEDEDGRSKRITFPASWDGQGKACYAANDYFELAPNDVYRSVSYWELRGDAVPFVPRRGDRGKWYGFRQSVRLVVWMNLQILGVSDAGNKLSDHLSVITMNALAGVHNVGVDYIDGVRVSVERKVRKSMDIFGSYSYSDRNELMLYPYDFFAIDFQVEWYVKRDCIPGEIPYKALKCAPIEVPGGGAWTPGSPEEECNCRWIDLPDRPTKLSEFENDLPCTFQTVDELPEDPDNCTVYLYDGKYWQWGLTWCMVQNPVNLNPASPPFFTDFSELPQPGDSQYTYVVQDPNTSELTLWYWSGAEYENVYFDGGNLPDDITIGQYAFGADGLVVGCQSYIDVSQATENLFTKDLVLTENRTHQLGSNAFRMEGGLNPFTIQMIHPNNEFRTTFVVRSNLSSISTTDLSDLFHRATVRTVFRNGEPILELETGQDLDDALLNGNVFLKLIDDGGRVEYAAIQFSDIQGDIEIPEYADDNAADADSDLASGAPYSLTGDRTVYRKP